MFIMHLPPGFQGVCVAMKRAKHRFKPKVDPIHGRRNRLTEK